MLYMVDVDEAIATIVVKRDDDCFRMADVDEAVVPWLQKSGVASA